MYYESSSPKHKAKERAKARKLRQSTWWQNLLTKGQCYYCEEQFKKDVLTMDHKVPVARGGVSSKSNVVVACKECNTNKKHLTPAEMILNP